MKLQLKSYLGECIMLFPNINFWTDDDPEYAPYRYQFFIGWLFWGLRIFFGKAEPQGVYAVRVIYNELKDKSYYVLTKTEYSEDLDEALTVFRITTDINEQDLTPEEEAAFCTSIGLKVITPSDDKRCIVAFSDIESAFLIRDLINRIRAKDNSDKWRIVKYRKMYINRFGV